MNDAEFDQALKRQIEQLPKALKPSRDLWAGIDHAIEQQQTVRRGYFPRLSAVAAGVAVLGLTFWLTGQNGQTSTAQPTEQLHYLTQMTQSFEQQKRALLVKYDDQQAATDNWRDQLKQLDDAAIAIKKALDADPTNAQLIKMLQQTYQQQLDLIKAVNVSPWQAI